MKSRPITYIGPNVQIGLRFVPFNLKEGIEALKEKSTSLCAKDITTIWGRLDETGKKNLILCIKEKGEADKLTSWLTEKILSSAKETRKREHLSRKVPIAVSSKKTKELAREIISALKT